MTGTAHYLPGKKGRVPHSDALTALVQGCQLLGGFPGEGFQEDMLALDENLV